MSVIMETMGKRKPRPRRSFTREFKAEIVELCQRGDRSVGQVAKDFDLTETAVPQCPSDDAGAGGGDDEQAMAGTLGALGGAQDRVDPAGVQERHGRKVQHHRAGVDGRGECCSEIGHGQQIDLSAYGEDGRAVDARAVHSQRRGERSRCRGGISVIGHLRVSPSVSIRWHHGGSRRRSHAVARSSSPDVERGPASRSR
jgi:hypothetical protein